MKMTSMLYALAILVSVMVFSSFASAAVTQWPDMFNSQLACEKAVAVGEVTPYKPHYTGDKDKEPVVNYKVIPSERWACFKLDVVGLEHKWVAEPPGTEFRFWKNADGTVEETPYQLHACGNTMFQFLFLDPPVPAKKVAERVTSLDLSLPEASLFAVAPPGALSGMSTATAVCYGNWHEQTKCPGVDNPPVAEKSFCRLSGWHTAGCIVGGMIFAGLLYNALDDDGGQQGSVIVLDPASNGTGTGSISLGTGTTGASTGAGFDGGGIN